MDTWTAIQTLIFDIFPFAWALQQRTTHTRHPIGSKKYEIFFLCSLRVWRAAPAPACPPPCSPPPSGLGTATQPSTRWVKSVCKYQEYESESFYFSQFFSGPAYTVFSNKLIFSRLRTFPWCCCVLNLLNNVNNFGHTFVKFSRSWQQQLIVCSMTDIQPMFDYSWVGHDWTPQDFAWSGVSRDWGCVIFEFLKYFPKLSNLEAHLPVFDLCSKWGKKG